MTDKVKSLRDNLENAEERLKNLHDRKAACESKVKDFENELSNLNIDNTNIAVSTLEKVRGGLEAHRILINRISDDILSARHDVEVIQLKINDVMSESIRNDEILAFKAAIEKLVELQGALEHLKKVHANLRRNYRKDPLVNFRGCLFVDIQLELDRTRRHYPQYLN